MPPGEQAQARIINGTLTNFSAPDKSKPGYHLTVTESSAKQPKLEFTISRYCYDTLNNLVVADGVIQRNSIQASINPKTNALYSIKLVYPQRDNPILNTDQDVFGNVPIIVVCGIVGAILLAFGIFSTIRVYLDRSAAPVSVIATVKENHHQKDAVRLKIVPTNDLYNRGKPFDIYISADQYRAINRAVRIEVSLSPALRHVYEVRSRT